MEHKQLNIDMEKVRQALALIHKLQIKEVENYNLLTTEYRGLLKQIKQVVKEGKEFTKCPELFLDFCKKRLPITYPKTFMVIYWYK